MRLKIGKMKARFLLSLLIFCLLLPVAAARAQQLAPITASVDRQEVEVFGTLTLTVTVTTDSLAAPSPEIPDMDGFDIVGTSTSSSFSLMNAQMRAQSTYVFNLRAMRLGDLLIEPFRITLDGKTYATEAISVRVVAAQSAPQNAPLIATPAQGTEQPPPPAGAAGKEFFIEAQVDNAAPYVGQAITYIFRFYQASELFGQPYYEAPKFEGFWSERQTSQNQYTQVVQGVRYQVSELRTLLFPTTAGEVTIAAARLTVPGGFFDADQELSSQALKVQVKALPSGAPPGFNGAVGQYTIKADLSATESKVNEPLTLKVTLSGVGNLRNLPDPQWQDAPGWRAFESKAHTDVRLENGQVLGSRVYERLLVPEKEGKALIPALRYVYFDPQAEEYKTVETQSFEVDVQAGAAEAPTPLSPAQKAQAEVQEMAADIRYLKPAPTVLYTARPRLTDAWLYWLLWLLPVFVVAGHFTWQTRQQRLQSNSAGVRSAQARRRAKKALAQARSGGVDVYTALAQVLLDYLEDKLNQPVQGLTHAARADLLAHRGVDEELIQRVQDCLTLSEVGRFSPLGGEGRGAAAVLDDLEKLLDDLEKVMER